MLWPRYSFPPFLQRFGVNAKQMGSDREEEFSSASKESKILGNE